MKNYSVFRDRCHFRMKEVVHTRKGRCRCLTQDTVPAFSDIYGGA